MSSPRYKLYEKEIKKINKAHTPPKYDRINRYNWKKSWGPCVRNQADWDGSYLLELIIYKLERMYASLDICSDEVREDLDKRLVSLKKAIELGKKIQNFDYEEKEYAFLKEHTTKYVLIYEGGNINAKNPKLLNKVKQVECGFPDDLMGTKLADDWCKENGYQKYKNCHYAFMSEWDDNKNIEKWREIIDECNKEEQKDTDTFFKLIARNYKGWWW